ncbi:MAG: DUF1134 domain-containing protein [Hyphomicrobiaceae bacterium]
MGLVIPAITRPFATRASRWRIGANRQHGGSGRPGSAAQAAVLALSLVFGLAAWSPPNARAATCTAEDFGVLIDGAGAALRELNALYAPQYDEKLRVLREERGLSESELRVVAERAVTDATVLGADQRVNELIGQIEAAGTEESSSSPDCARLDDLAAQGIELKAAIRLKWTRLIAILDSEIAGAGASALASAGATTETTEGGTAKKGTGAGTGVPKTAEAGTRPGKEPTAKAARKDAGSKTETLPWQTEALPDPDYGIATIEPSPGAAGTETYVAPYGVAGELETYSIAEIQAAGRGFFGTISTELASVIGHAFEQLGRPNGFILGSEGGGAVIAGLRYGNGRIHTRGGGSQRIYWQGPTLGYDLGAEGGRTMMLVYNLKSVDGLYKHFAAADGSAYLIGGVGMTVVTDGDVVIAPIRSGLGLRLGANVGFLKFTPEPTINPF